jgi:hypothetical protein
LKPTKINGEFQSSFFLSKEFFYIKKNSSENDKPPSNDQQNAFPIPAQRFRPFIQTTKSIASLFQDPLAKLNSISKEIKPQIISAAIDVKDKVLNVLGVETNSSNQQQGIDNRKDNQQADQNVPAPPLANNAQRQQQPGHVESAQAAPEAHNGDSK